jgi:hypothetical protein
MVNVPAVGRSAAINRDGTTDTTINGREWPYQTRVVMEDGKRLPCGLLLSLHLMTVFTRVHLWFLLLRAASCLRGYVHRFAF